MSSEDEPTNGSGAVTLNPGSTAMDGYGLSPSRTHFTEVQGKPRQVRNLTQTNKF